MRSRERLQQVYNGVPLDDVLNQGKNPDYRLERMGAGDNGRMRSFKQPMSGFEVYDAAAPLGKPDTSSLARAALVKIENEIRQDKNFEHGVFVDLNGNELLRRTGAPNKVTFSETELGSMQGVAFTHNHPGGASFSWDDVANASEFGIKEVRVVTGRARYIATGIDKIWYGSVRRAYVAAQPQGKELALELVRKGKLSMGYVALEAVHQTWIIVAKRLGFTYLREAS